MVLIKLSFIFILAAAEIALVPLQVIALPVKLPFSSSHKYEHVDHQSPSSYVNHEHDHQSPSSHVNREHVDHGAPKGSTSIPMTKMNSESPPGHQHIESGSRSPTRSNSGSSTGSIDTAAHHDSSHGGHNPHAQQPPPTPEPQKSKSSKVSYEPVIGMYAAAAHSTESTRNLIDKNPDHQTGNLIKKVQNCLAACLGTIGIGFPDD